MIRDATTIPLRRSFLNLRKAERYYQRQLAQVARQIGHIVRGMAPEGVVTNIGERLFKLNTEAITTSARAKEIQQEILASGRVSLATAKMLARTGVSTTATAITKARAEHIGSPGYIWRTSKDGAVRPSHRVMEGRFVEWGKPPTLDNYTAHCGEFANCRCFPEPIIPDRFGTH